MKIERTKNAARSIIFGGLLKAYQILLPFVIRTVMLYFLGVEYLGLNSLFVSILQVLNLAELGVGSAMVCSMYKPIADDDTTTICALMRLYKIYYRIIGLIVLIAGIVISPFLPYLVKGGIPSDLNLYILYFLNLGATVCSYWLFAYKSSIFFAFQRNDIISKVQLLTNSIQYIIQIVVVIFLRNYYLFLIVAMFAQILNNILAAILAQKYYPQYKAIGSLDKVEEKKINQRIRDLFTAKLGGVIVNSADSIVISAFLGLTSLAIYQNYFYIITSITAFILVIYKSCLAGIGNSLVVESLEKNYNDFQTISLGSFWIFGFCIVCFLCLFQPFMTLWVGEDLLLSIIMVVLFCLYFYFYQLMNLFSLYKDAAGIWHQDRFRPLIEAAVNLILNLILVQFIGLYGILLSTIISMAFVSLPWLCQNLFKYVFKCDCKNYLKLLIAGFFVIICVSAITYLACFFIPIDGFWGLIIRAGICVILSNGLYFVIFRKFPGFDRIVNIVKRLLKKSKGGEICLKD